MRAPMSWLRELVMLPAGTTTEEIARRWTAAGLNVEHIDKIGAEVSGPVVVGKVLSFVDEPQHNGKVIRWCRVDVGPEHNHPATDTEPAGRGIVCGAHNFDAGDFVVVSLPGAVLPGGFEISARKTYGHLSDGMICAADELGIGTDHTGIIVLKPDSEARPLVLGEDAMAVLHGRDDVIDTDVTPDMGFCLSMRGLARETGQAFGVVFPDPFLRAVPEERQNGYPVRVEDAEACPLFTALTVRGVHTDRPTPQWMARRLEMCGMRSISLLVDITNYVMLESGQPLHAYDADRLQGTIVVRRAGEGETLTTLDDQQRTLRAGEDLLICDDSGPIGLAGVMGGQTTELSDSTKTIVLEAAAFNSVVIGRTYRAHHLPSEASKRFERGVDTGLAFAANHRAAQLLVQLAGGILEPDDTIVGHVAPMPQQHFQASLPGAILGAKVSREEIIGVLTTSGCKVTALGDTLTVVPPTWRPDLVDPYDYVEEVGCKIGLDRIGSLLPPATGGRGLTPQQRGRRRISAAVVDAGFVEVQSLPFISTDELDALSIPDSDARRRLVRLANPLADTQPYLRTTLLPGLVAAVNRNTSRGQEDLALFETGLVFRQRDDLPAAPMPEVDKRPSDEEIAALNAALPDQPRMLAGILTGDWLPAGWHGPAIKADWTHAVALAQVAAASLGVTVERRADDVAPWHPGRCAALLVGDEVIGWAGELHPGVVKACGLPERTCAVEFDEGRLLDLAPRGGVIPPLSAWPLAKEDVALIVDAALPQSEVADALRAGAGDLLESVSLFDTYTGPQVGEGRKSLAFALRFRAPDRTLTDAETAAARDAAVAEATRRFGAELRG